MKQKRDPFLWPWCVCGFVTIFFVLRSYWIDTHESIPLFFGIAGAVLLMLLIHRLKQRERENAERADRLEARVHSMLVQQLDGVRHASWNAIKDPDNASLHHAQRRQGVHNFLWRVATFELSEKEIFELIDEGLLDLRAMRDVVFEMNVKRDWPTERPSWANAFVDASIIKKHCRWPLPEAKAFEESLLN